MLQLPHCFRHGALPSYLYRLPPCSLPSLPVPPLASYLPPVSPGLKKCNTPMHLFVKVIKVPYMHFKGPLEAVQNSDLRVRTSSLYSLSHLYPTHVGFV